MINCVSTKQETFPYKKVKRDLDVQLNFFRELTEEFESTIDGLENELKCIKDQNSREKQSLNEEIENLHKQVLVGYIVIGYAI